MIEPAGTSWPSPTLTPRRWPTESRPFLELEPAFLWATDQSSFFGAAGRFGAGFAASLAGVFAFAAAGFAFAAAGFALSAAGAPAFAAPRASFFTAGVAASAGVAAASAAAAFEARVAASAASVAAWTAATSASRSRSVLRASASTRSVSAALLPLSVTSVTRRIVCSWRWPFLTRRRALGLYLNEITLSARQEGPSPGADD